MIFRQIDEVLLSKLCFGYHNNCITVIAYSWEKGQDLENRECRAQGEGGGGGLCIPCTVWPPSKLSPDCNERGLVTGGGGGGGLTVRGKHLFIETYIF